MQLLLGAQRSLGERDGDVGAQVGSRFSHGLGRVVAAAEEIAEDVAELTVDVVDVGESFEPALSHAGLPAEVVGLALLGVAEHGVGFGDFLELLLRLLVARIAVGVVLERELAVSLLDLVLRSRAADSEDFIVVFVADHSSMHSRASVPIVPFSYRQPDLEHAVDV